MRIVKDGKDNRWLQITNLKKLGYFFQDRQTVTYSIKEGHVLKLSFRTWDFSLTVIMYNK